MPRLDDDLEDALRSLDVGMSERAWRGDLEEDGYGPEEIDLIVEELKRRIDRA